MSGNPYRKYMGWRAYKAVLKSLWGDIRALSLFSFNDVDLSAHRHPWAYIFVTILAATIISALQVGMARAERDESQLELRKQEIVNDTLQLKIDELTIKLNGVCRQ